MSKHILNHIPVSVLDLAPILEGETVGDALQHARDLAIALERLGYHRVWYAEHHNMPNIASSATAVLIGFIAGATHRIRVGSGGVMLPNHAPLVIAEQFGTLEALYPGRIDLGLGRAPGTDQLTSMALRRRLTGSVDHFPEDVTELRNYLAVPEGPARVRAYPGQGSEVPIWLLGSSTYSAQLAAMLGLPFAFASHFAPTHLQEALHLYRTRFTPSEQLSEPYVMACVNVIAAETDQLAESLASSFYRLALGIIRDERKPLQPPVDSMDGLWTEYEQASVMHMMKYTYSGSPERIKAGLQQFVADTGVNELMVTSYIFDQEAKIRSYEILSDIFSERKSG